MLQHSNKLERRYKIGYNCRLIRRIKSKALSAWCDNWNNVRVCCNCEETIDI